MSLSQYLPRSVRQRCESIATEQRSLLGLKAFDPCPARLLTKKLSAVVLTPQEVPNTEPEQISLLLNSDKWSAGIIHRNPTWIVYNPRHASTRQESSLMHEVAHILLSHNSVGFDRDTGLPLRSDRDEKEADFLGGCLQIPRRGLLWATQRGMNKREIANYFLSSQKMVAFRSNMTGVKIER